MLQLVFKRRVSNWGIIWSTFCILFFLEAGVASITTTYIMCNNHMNETINGNIICPKSWHYVSYEEAAIGSRNIATNLFNCYVAFIVIGLMCTIINGMCISSTKKNDYTII